MLSVAPRRLALLSLCMLTVWQLAGCRVSRVLLPEVDAGDENWLKKESSHYFIYYRPGSPASQSIDQIAELLDSCFEDVLIQLDVNFSSKISYYLYNSSDELERWAGWHRWGFFVGEFEYVAQVYDTPRKNISSHETAHVIAYHTIGMSKLIFLNEGIAEAVAHCHERTPGGELVIHETCKRLLAQNDLFSLDVLTDNGRFEEIYRSPDARKYYYQSGSLVRYLIDEYGLIKFKSLLPKTTQDNYKRIFYEIYDQSIEEFGKQWRQFLRDY